MIVPKRAKPCPLHSSHSCSDRDISLQCSRYRSPKLPILKHSLDMPHNINLIVIYLAVMWYRDGTVVYIKWMINGAPLKIYGIYIRWIIHPRP